MIKQIEELREFIKDNNRNIEHQQDIIYLQDEVCGSLAAGTHGAGGHLIKVIQWGRQMLHEKTSRAWDGSQISSTLTANNAGGGTTYA